jgi:hypothetical protein
MAHCCSLQWEEQLLNNQGNKNDFVIQKNNLTRRCFSFSDVTGSALAEYIQLVNVNETATSKKDLQMPKAILS